MYFRNIFGQLQWLFNRAKPLRPGVCDSEKVALAAPQTSEMSSIPREQEWGRKCVDARMQLLASEWGSGDVLPRELLYMRVILHSFKSFTLVESSTIFLQEFSCRSKQYYASLKLDTGVRTARPFLEKYFAHIDATS